MRNLILIGILLTVIACNSSNTVVNESELTNGNVLRSSGVANFNGDISRLYEVTSSVKLKLKGRDFLESIDKIEQYGGKLYVLNRFGVHAGLYAFDANTGDFLGSYGEKNDGIGSYSVPYDFDIDEKSNTMELLTLRKILVFNLDSFEYLKTSVVAYSAVRFKKQGDNYFFVRGGREEPYFTYVDYQVGKEYSYFEDGGPSHHNYPYNAIIEGYSNTYVQLNYCNQVYKISEDNTLKERYKVVFDGQSLDQDYVNSLQSPQEIREEMSSSKIVKEFFFELKDYFYFSFIYNQQQFVNVISKTTGKEITYNVTKVSNDLTDEEYPPFIVNQSGDQLIAIKSLENDQSETDHDFEVFFIKIKSELF